MPIPPMKAAATSATTTGSMPSISIGSALRVIASMPQRRGRSSR